MRQWGMRQWEKEDEDRDETKGKKETGVKCLTSELLFHPNFYKRTEQGIVKCIYQ